MYNIASYGRMIADSVRIKAYEEALRRSISPTSIVLDIGTGTGIFALMACRLGARRVYAVEPSDAITVAREIAAANGFADRIEFIQNISTKVELPERADVIVSDLRGALPYFQRHIPSIVDARVRLLAAGGVLIPLCDTLWAGVVEQQEFYDAYLAPWRDGLGFDMSAATRYITNTGRTVRVKPENLLVTPRPCITLDYDSVEEADARASLAWSVERAGTGHGLALWFETRLFEEVGFSNSPWEPALIHGHAFLPWLTPVALREGDSVAVNLHAQLMGEEYLWRWDTRVKDRGGAVRCDVEFKQSTLFGVPLSAERLRKRAHNYVPALNQEGEVDKFTLARMNEGLTLGEIADWLVRNFPRRFANRYEALTRVAEVAEKYCR